MDKKYYDKIFSDYKNTQIIESDYSDNDDKIPRYFRILHNLDGE